MNPNPAKSDLHKEARRFWEEAQANILAKYPAMGVAGPAAEKFALMFRALGSDPRLAEAVADLVMIYPPTN